MGSVLEEAIARFPDDPTLHLLYAEALLAQERLADVRDEIDRFSEITFGGDPQIDYLRARIELATGDSGKAALRLKNLAPLLDTSNTQYWLGRALEASGDIEGARRRYGLAQGRNRASILPVAALISLAQQRGAWKEVAHHARNMVRLAPQRFEGWAALMIALENLGDTEAIEQVANRCLDRFPDRAESRILFAKALRTQRRYDEALKAIAEAEAAGGRSVLIVAERVVTLGMAGRVDEGLAVAHEALATAPDSAEIHAALATLLYAAGAAEQGSRATDRALALDPEGPRPLRARCEFRASIGHWVAAKADCERYLSARPGDARVHFTLGVILQSLGDRQSAIAAYRRASELDERDARALNNLAVLLAADDNLEGALAAAQEAYRRDEANPYVMDTLGELYLRKGLTERAISLLEDARAAAPELDDATLHLALAYRDSGRTHEARVLLVDLKQGSTEDAAMREQIEEALHSLP
jgi:tetratricopeptide (TPR) repeat protein